MLYGAVRRGGGAGALLGGGTALPSRHAVGEVVDAEHGDVRVAAGGVDEVVAPNGNEVAVTAVNDHLQVRVGGMEAQRERDGATVGGVEAIAVYVAGNAAGASDAGDDRERVHVNPGFFQRLHEAGDGRADAAARAPDVGKAVCAQAPLNRVGRRLFQREGWRLFQQLPRPALLVADGLFVVSVHHGKSGPTPVLQVTRKRL